MIGRMELGQDSIDGLNAMYHMGDMQRPLSAYAQVTFTDAQTGQKTTFFAQMTFAFTGQTRAQAWNDVTLKVCTVTVRSIEQVMAIITHDYLPNVQDARPEDLIGLTGELFVSHTGKLQAYFGRTFW